MWASPVYLISSVPHDGCWSCQENRATHPESRISRRSRSSREFRLTSPKKAKCFLVGKGVCFRNLSARIVHEYHRVVFETKPAEASASMAVSGVLAVRTICRQHLA